MKCHQLELLWSKGNGVLNPSALPHVICSHLKCLQWVLTRSFYRVQIDVIVVLELDYPLKKMYCRTLHITLWNVVETTILSNEQRI